MPLSLLNHSALALVAQRTRIPTSSRSSGFCAIWVCISSSFGPRASTPHTSPRLKVIRALFHGSSIELELDLIQTQMKQKPMLRAEVGMRVHCANRASAE